MIFKHLALTKYLISDARNKQLFEPSIWRFNQILFKIIRLKTSNILFVMRTNNLLKCYTENRVYMKDMEERYKIVLKMLE